MASYTKKSPWPPRSNPDLVWSRDWQRPTTHEYSQAFIAWGLPYNALEDKNEPKDPKLVLVRHILRSIRLGEESRGQYLDKLADRIAQYQQNPNHVFDSEMESPVLYDRLPYQSDVTHWTMSEWAPPPKWGLSRQFLELNRNLGYWGVKRDKKYLIQEGPNDQLTEFSAWELYTISLANSPYNPTYWIARAFQFFRDSFYDLALGDAYRAMVLVEVITDPFQRNRRTGLYNLVHSAVEQHLTRAAREEPPIMEKLRSNLGVPYFLYPLRQAVNHIISLCLLQLGDWKDYEIHEQYLLDRLIMTEADKKLFQGRQSRMRDAVDRWKHDKLPRHTWRHEIRGGFVSGKRHPQAQPVDRSAEAFRQRLTVKYVRGCAGVDADLLEVRVTPDGGLGVFASKDIAAGTLILVDEPNVRGLSRYVEDREKVLALDEYARSCQDSMAVTTEPPKIDPERYRCENCFRRPRKNEVLQARRQALLLKAADNSDDESEMTKYLKQYLCYCATKDPHIYFCWRDTKVAEDTWDELFQPSSENAAVQRRVEHRDRTAIQKEQEQLPDQEDMTDIIYYGLGGEIAGHTDERMSGGVISDGEYDTSSIEGEMHFNIGGRKKHKKEEGGRVRTRLPNGRYTCFHRCSQSGRHKCCALGVPVEPEPESPGILDMYPLSPLQLSPPRRPPGPEALLSPIRPPRSREESPHDSHQDSTEYEDEFEGGPAAQCVQIARSVFHHSACGIDWRWLYEATQSHWEDHNTILSILLRDVFDMTIEKQKKEHRRYIVPSEIDPMIMLSGGEDRPSRKFPFSWSGNIVVPFDILEALGVDIFRDHRFDTWTIQVVLRKLLINACPWDPHRRGDTADASNPSSSVRQIPDMLQPSTSNPELNDLRSFVVHCGFALINHGCANAANATWGFDLDERHDGHNRESEPGIPNMIWVQTERAVEAGEEILIRYFPDQEPNRRRWKARRLFGEDCRCESCAEARAAGVDLDSSPSPDPEPFSPEAGSDDVVEVEAPGATRAGRSL
ncbi:MAG: hypothetical protein M1839_005580 [Geoglossum umbratile]|nr:MAG: hypothetical protein M1839_005580 [Geoglossum umbratile]